MSLYIDDVMSSVEVEVELYEESLPAGDEAIEVSELVRSRYREQAPFDTGETQESASAVGPASRVTKDPKEVSDDAGR